MKAPFGPIQRQSHLVEAVNHNLTAAAVFGNHIVNVLTAVFQCRNRAVLCRNAGQSTTY